MCSFRWFKYAFVSGNNGSSRQQQQHTNTKQSYDKLNIFTIVSSEIDNLLDADVEIQKQNEYI